ncbi:uncharacterized protein RSE6_16063 [Rhynchosporium secalis]|uniref:Homeobox domain-containing protein n=1 Tax=Rhynchosporium secalis TaxID=38038 RepID=A0A1E1M6Y7_RHYSE|nr:uncharacterized protein RSE6_16063 [Rhynchosporium secalis]
MTSRTLELGSFNLVHSAESLKLIVTASAHFQGPKSITNLDEDAFAQALESRKLWVTRGRGCRIDVEVLQDGKPLARTSSRKLEVLGCQIRDAQAWNQLILSPSLKLPPEDPSDLSSHFSVYIKNSIKPPQNSDGLAAWIGDIDVTPPPAVLCLELEKIQMQFDFRPIHPPFIVEVIEEIGMTEETPTEFEAFDDMLLESPLRSPHLSSADTKLSAKAEAQSLEKAVEGLKGLAKQVEGLFGTLRSSTFEMHSPSRLASRARKTECKPENDAISADIPAPGMSTDGDSKKKATIFEHAVGVLDSWFCAHGNNLYPTMEEKTELMVETGLSRAQLNALLYRRRQKFRKGLLNENRADSKEETQDGMMLDDSVTEIELPPVAWYEEEMMLCYGSDSDRIIEELGGDESISSQSSNLTSTIFHSQSSIPSTISSKYSTGAESQSFLKESLSRQSLLLDSPGSMLLADTAFRTLMGAAVPRSYAKRQDIAFKRLPQLCMSTLIPSMLCPGFKNLMAVSSRFLATISHAVSVSMPRNVQTPSLRRKLLQISNMELSPLLTTNSGTGQPGTGERLSSVVQSCLWEIMQRKLFDRSAGRRLWRPEVTGGANSDEEFEDMLEIFDDNELDTEFEARKENLDSEEMLFWDDEDEKLLLDNDEDSYDVDWEQHAIEEVTDEMLLGDEWSCNRHHDEGSMLLDGSDTDLLGHSEGESSMIISVENEEEPMLL